MWLMLIQICEEWVPYNSVKSSGSERHAITHVAVNQVAFCLSFNRHVYFKNIKSVLLLFVV